MTIELAKLEGVNLEAKCEEISLDQLMNALKVFKDKVEIEKNGPRDYTLNLIESGAEVDIWMVTDQDNLDETDYSPEDVPVVRMSLPMSELSIKSNDESATEPNNEQVDNLFTIMRAMSAAFDKRFAKPEEAYMCFWSDYEIHMDIDLLNGPTIRKVAESLVFLIQTANDTENFLKSFVESL